MFNFLAYLRIIVGLFLQILSKKKSTDLGRILTDEREQQPNIITLTGPTIRCDFLCVAIDIQK